MIDRAFQTVAEQIHGVLMPGINQAIFDAIHSPVFQKMTTDEIQIACIKLALEAVALIALIWIGRKIRCIRKKNPKKIEIKRGKKTDIPEPLWTTDGWYWDDKKGKWIGPDFPSQKK